MKSSKFTSYFLTILSALFLLSLASCQKERIEDEKAKPNIKAQAIQGDASPRIRKHAPYLYLAKKGSTEYDMYIIVPVNDGEKITAGSFVSTENSTVKQLDITVVADPSVHQEYAVLHKTFSAEATSFELAAVNVDNAGNIDYTGKIRLADASEDNVTDESDLAYCRPYAYLAKDAAGQFVPYVLLPLKADKAATDNAPSGNVDCAQAITINSQSPATQDRIVSDLQINGKGFSYPDANFLISNGGLTVEVVSGISEGNKVKIKNKHSDPK